MRLFFTVILMYVLMAIAAGSAGIWPTPGGQPNLCMAGVVIAGLLMPRTMGLPAAFLLGLLQDAVSVGPIGVHAFAYGATAWVLGRVVASIDGRHPLAHAVSAGFGQFVLLMVGAIQSYLVVTLGLRAGPALELPPDLTYTLLSGFYTFLLTPLVVFVVLMLARVVGVDFTTQGPGGWRGGQRGQGGRSGRGLGRNSATWAGGGR